MDLPTCHATVRRAWGNVFPGFEDAADGADVDLSDVVAAGSLGRLGKSGSQFQRLGWKKKKKNLVAVDAGLNDGRRVGGGGVDTSSKPKRYKVEARRVWDDNAVGVAGQG